jgi:hypothetical protein
MTSRATADQRDAAQRQRAELTFKHNLGAGRHGWLRLTPAYSVKIVDSILSTAELAAVVLDPFSGTATTPLCAAMRGHSAVSVEINPFLAWFGQAKVARYSADTILAAKDRGSEVSGLAIDEGAAAASPPPIHNIERWWSEQRLAYLCRLKAGLDGFAGQPRPVCNLLAVAFCRTLIRLSNAAFNHQSMSFKPAETHRPQLELWNDDREDVDYFGEDLEFILGSASHNPPGDAAVTLGDARTVGESLDRQFDLLVTSPPYPNRISYIRELRPYMYWLGYLEQSRDAGELDWSAIGGTWGIATSRLAEWRKSPDAFIPGYVDELIGCIASSDAKSGRILGNYVGKYFDDIWQHLTSVRRLMKSGAPVHYIVGNSKFYNVVVPTERIYRDMLTEAGFQRAEIHTIRKRNSKKELLEFDVRAIA